MTAEPQDARAIAFSNGAVGPLTFDERYAFAVDPPDQRTKRDILWHNARDADWWGPGGNPGVVPVRLEQDRAGTFVTLAGRRVPALIDGAILRVGIPGRVGYCAAWALTAADRLLRDPEASSVVLVFGRVFGSAQQAWCEYNAGGRPMVADLTLDETPFERSAYEAALLARAGTRIPMPDRATLAAFREAAELADPWDEPRDRFLARLSAAGAAEGVVIMGATIPVKAVAIATGLGLGALGVTAAANLAALAGVAIEALPLWVAEWEAREKRLGYERDAELARAVRDFKAATKGVNWGPRPETAAKT